MGALVTIATFLVLAAPAAARPRADLVVPKGTLAAASGTLTGSFTVRNAGRRPARRFSVGLKAGTRLVATFAVRGLAPRTTKTVRVRKALPTGLPAGSLALRVCADPRGNVRERSEKNNCRRVGTLVVASDGSPSPSPSPSPDPSPAPTPTPSTAPTDPFPFTKESVITPGSGRTYWAFVPSGYDTSHQTPMRLLVWLHGCGSNSADEISTVTKDDTSYLAIAIDGREGDCWDPNADGPKVLQAIANMKTHFNIDPHHVVVGGYSGGGDLAYRTAFYNANTFAGVLAENTLPFRDTGSTQSQSLAAAAWKFNVVHLAHTSDSVYTLPEVENETKAMQDAGFPVTLIQQPGGHSDSTTTPDLQTHLLPHMGDPWSSP